MNVVSVSSGVSIAQSGLYGTLIADGSVFGGRSRPHQRRPGLKNGPRCFPDVCYTHLMSLCSLQQMELASFRSNLRQTYRLSTYTPSRISTASEERGRSVGMLLQSNHAVIHSPSNHVLVNWGVSPPSASLARDCKNSWDSNDGIVSCVSSTRKEDGSTDLRAIRGKALREPPVVSRTSLNQAAR